MKNKTDWQGIGWIIFHGINWRGDLRSAARALYKKNFPALHQIIDKAKYYRDMAGIDRNTLDYKEQLISQSIKTDFGKVIIAKAMIGGKL